MTYTLNTAVTVNNTSSSPVLTKYADNIQLDSTGRLKTSIVQHQEWYNSVVDKDGDFRMTEAFYSNIIATTSNGAQTGTTINVASSTNIYPGAILTAVSGVNNNPQTIVTAVPNNSSVTLNQSVTTVNGETLVFNNYRRITTATGAQTGITSLIVGSTTSILIGDFVTNQNTSNQFPANTFVISITNATTVVLNQPVTVTNGDTINFDHSKSYFNVLQGDLTLNSGFASDGRVIRQTRSKQQIIPGASHTLYQAVNFNGIDTNVTKRFGIFDGTNGLFWELDGVGGNLNVVVRRTLSDGSILEDRVARNSFTYDKLDGTGSSGVDITTTTSIAITGFASITPGILNGYNVTWNVTTGQGNSFQTDSNVLITGITPSSYNGVYTVVSSTPNTITVNYPTNPGTYSGSSSPTMYQSGYHKYYTWFIEFLGGRTGRIRFGIVTDSGATITHQFSYSGDISTTYVTEANMPTRWEIVNSSNQLYQPTMFNAGYSFNIETGKSLTHGSIGVAVGVAGGFASDSTLRPIIGFSSRPSYPYNSADLKLKTICLVDQANRSNTSAGVYFWELIINPTITGTIPSPITTGKSSQYYQYTVTNAIAANTGITVANGYFFNNITECVSNITEFLNLGCDVTGYIPDQMVLCIQQIAAGTNSASILATMNWSEGA